MHDGGTDTRLFINEQLVCKSVMYYAAREGYISANSTSDLMAASGDVDAHSAGTGVHISDPGKFIPYSY